MKRILAAALAAAMMCGCAADLARYPRVALQSPGTQATLALSLTLPQEADDILTGSTVLLDAKLQELSGQSIVLQTSYSTNPLQDYQNGEAGLYLLNAAQITALDERLAFVQMPFMAKDSAALVAMLGNQQGTVRNAQITAQRLQGALVGVYYGGTVLMLSRGKFYDDIGFYSTTGTLDSMSTHGMELMGAEQCTPGSQQQILDTFAAGETKFCELEATGLEALTPQLAESIKAVVPTFHRSKSWWLVLRDPEGTLNPLLIAQLREAFAYTLDYQDGQRRQQDDAFLKTLSEQGLPIDEEGSFAATRQRTRRSYRESWKELGIPQDIWAQVIGLL